MSSKSSKAGVALIGLAAAAALMSLPATAGAHATVSPFQPQTTPLTSARTSYVLRVPNEKFSQPTYKVVLFVPKAIQEAISVRQSSDWKTRLTRVNTGKKNEEGDPLLATTAITWVAKQGSQIDPGFFGEFFIRWQNPATPQALCFPVHQYYRGATSAKGKKKGKKARRAAKPEIVRWIGPPSAEFPASCVNVAAAPPGP
jgi:uncharacterized protein YcnI